MYKRQVLWQLKIAADIIRQHRGGLDKETLPLQPRIKPPRGKHGGIRAFLPNSGVRQQLGRHHGGAHSPFVKSGGQKHPVGQTPVGADIGDPVMGHTVLGRPLENRPRPGIKTGGRLLQPAKMILRRLVPGLVCPPAEQQPFPFRGLVRPEGIGVVLFVVPDIHSFQLRGVLEGQQIGALLPDTGEIPPRLVQKGKMRAQQDGCLLYTSRCV